MGIIELDGLNAEDDKAEERISKDGSNVRLNVRSAKHIMNAILNQWS